MLPISVGFMYSERMITYRGAGEDRSRRPDIVGRERVDLACRTDEGICDEITTLAAQISAATYRFLVLVSELDRRRPWGGDGIVSTAHWLRVRCGIDRVAAHEKVRVARALESLPHVSEAFARGQLSYSKVRAITRVATPENEESLAGAARFGTADHVEKLVRLHRRVDRQREAAATAESHAKRLLRYWQNADGSIGFEGRLPAEQGAVFVNALAAARDALQVFPAENTAEPAEARNADALLVLAETTLAHGPTAQDGGDRYVVSVHVTDTVLTAEGDGPPPELGDGTPIAAETARRIACDCSRVCVHEGEGGEILSVGRRTRQVPAAIRRALRARDRKCAFPGCMNSRFVDAHHIQHWADGGETKLANLVLLCRRHHGVVHEGGWRVEHCGAEIRFVHPHRGALSVPTVLGDQHLRAVEDLTREHESRGLVIGRDTIIPEWRGERILWHWAIDNLLDRSGGRNPFVGLS